MAKTITELRQTLQNCGSSLRASDFKDLLDYLQQLEDGTIGIPSITGFSLNVKDIVGSQTININKASFNIVFKDKVIPNSLRIVYLGDNSTIASGLALESPQVFNTVSLSVSEGNSYSWRAYITDIEGKEHASNIYTIKCKELPTNTMYYGNTSIDPQTFPNLPIDQIFALSGINTKTIKGITNQQFVIHQTSSIHYLLIPEDSMDLILAQYGTILITTLWDNSTQSGTYYTNNTGGVYNGIKYRVFFSYSPMGAFPDDIIITCKNK